MSLGLDVATGQFQGWGPAAKDEAASAITGDALHTKDAPSGGDVERMKFLPHPTPFNLRNASDLCYEPRTHSLASRPLDTLREAYRMACAVWQSWQSAR